MEEPPSQSQVSWGAEGGREPVLVDQRGLIDKILARYSSKFPVLRELLQNADDAQAKRAFIRFETEAFVQNRETGERPNLDCNVSRWTIHNDGNKFQDKDWNRLKTIADGNPDQQKIGAFGVGFYSVFSITDEPCILSGGKKMRFHWGSGIESKQLYVSRSSTLTEDSSKWTTFELSAHTPSPLPGTTTDIGRFLAASLPFMVHLQTVTVAFDSHPLLHLTKTSQKPIYLPLLDHLAPGTAPGFMSISDVSKREVKIEAKSWFYEGSSSTPSTLSFDKTMLVWSAGVDVVLDVKSELGSGLNKAMKKAVPEACSFQLIYTGNDEAVEQESDLNCVFERLKPNLEGVEAYVHGHATTQTTGIAGHVAARFIPTVERELIDFENKHVKTWNECLLEVGGYLARTIYEHELQVVAEDPTQHSRGLHALQFFTFHNSTPHSCFSQRTKDAFFSCATSSLPILSSRGVLPAGEVRSYDVNCSVFVKTVPMLPLEVADGAKLMIQHLTTQNIIRVLDFQDLMQELTPDRILTEHEMISCFKWILSLPDSQRLSADERTKFLNAAQFTTQDAPNTVSLAQVHKLLEVTDKSFIPYTSPLPPDTLPHAISAELPLSQLTDLFGWKPLTVVDWLENLIALLEHDTITQGDCARIVFTVISGAWGTLGEKGMGEIAKMMMDLAWVPTQLGMKKAREVCFRDVEAAEFLDVPMLRVEGEMVVTDDMRDFLKVLGVQPRVDLLTLLKAAESHDKALRYFLDNYSHYKQDYEDDSKGKMQEIQNLAFVPVKNLAGESSRVKLSEAFIEKRCEIMGFWIVTDEFQTDAAKLKVAAEPPSNALVKALRERPPTNKENADRYFTYLSTRSGYGHFKENQLADMSTTKFVPVSDSLKVEPSKCYLGKPSIPLYGSLFTFVELEDSSTPFLLACKAKREPTADDIARALAHDPEKFLKFAGGFHPYMRELKNLADNRVKISDEAMGMLRGARVLLGCPYKYYGMSHKPWDGEEKRIPWEKVLLSNTEVVIIDDGRNYELFKDVTRLYHAPKPLDKFYLELGCKRLGTLIEEDYIPIGDELLDPQSRQRCAETRELVLQRLGIFVPSFSDEKAQERYEWLSARGKLVVRVHHRLQVLKVLNFGEKTEERRVSVTCGYIPNGEDSWELLLTTSQIDHFEVASCITKLFFESPSSHLNIVLMTLLSTPLDVLRQRGYNVEINQPQRRRTIEPAPIDFRVIREAELDVRREQEENLLSPSATPTLNKRSKWHEEFLTWGRGSSWQKTPAKWEEIDKDLVSAISSSPGTRDARNTSTAVQLRKEKANKYCGGSKYKRKLEEIHADCEYGIWIGEGVPIENLTKKATCIQQFILRVIEPLRPIFEFPKQNVRIVFDPECLHLTAFNRDGAVYLNLAHFEREHFVNGAVSNLPSVLLSWYFTLAHEFTHNIVPTHNANFELVFSRMCQQYAVKLFGLPPLRQAVAQHSPEERVFMGFGAFVYGPRYMC